MSLRRPHCHYPKNSFYHQAMKVAAAIVTMGGAAWVSVLNEGGQVGVTPSPSQSVSLSEPFLVTSSKALVAVHW